MLRLCYHRPVFGQTFILGVGAEMLLEGRSKNLVTYLKPFYIFADSLNLTG